MAIGKKPYKQRRVDASAKYGVKISDELKTQYVEGVRSGRAKMIRRISNRRVLYTLEINSKTKGFVYNSATAEIELFKGQIVDLTVGLRVWWKQGTAVRTGEIVLKIEPGTIAPSFVGQFKEMDHRHLLVMDPRPEVSWLVMTVDKSGNKRLEWPQASRLRTEPIKYRKAR